MDGNDKDRKIDDVVEKQKQKRNATRCRTWWYSRSISIPIFRRNSKSKSHLCSRLFRRESNTRDSNPYCNIGFRGVGGSNFFPGSRKLPVLPHTTLVELLDFCDVPTLLAFRGVSRVFRDLEIPREFHYRTVKRLSPKGNSKNEHQSRTQTRRRIPPTPAIATATAEASTPEIDCSADASPVASTSTSTRRAVRYSYNQKVIDEEHRKVWIFLRDTTGDERNNGSQTLSKIHPATTSCSNITSNNHIIEINSNLDNSESIFDFHPHHWSLPMVATKVLNMIRDMEFYNGVVFGYDEARAKQLLLQKGCIDEGDFPQPVSSEQPETNSCAKHHHNYKPSSSCGCSSNSDSNSNNNVTSTKNLFAVYGRWRAEASVRPVSLREALTILSDKESIQTEDDKPKRRWRRHLPKLRKREIKFQMQMQGRNSAQRIRRSGSVDENNNKNRLAMSLLMAASGRSSPFTHGDRDCDGDDACIRIRLAEYTTVFERTKMSCSVLLVRTHGGAEAEVRVLSGRVEPPESVSWWKQ